MSELFNSWLSESGGCREGPVIRRAVFALQSAGFGPLFVADVLDYCRTGEGTRAARQAALSIVLPALGSVCSGPMSANWN